MKQWIINTLAALAIVAVAANTNAFANLRGFFVQSHTAADIKNADNTAIKEWQGAPGFFAKKLRAEDGDSLVAGRRRIRLLCIDAPERAQPHSGDAKAFLAKLVKGGANIRTKGKDQYGRHLAIVIVKKDNKQLIANYEMLRRGYAWTYKQYAGTCGLPEPVLFAMEQQARQTQKGLWQSPDPTPPWQHRHPPRPQN